MFRWIISRRRTIMRSVPRRPSRDYGAYKEPARALITERLRYFAELHGFVLKRVAIKNTKRSWGSCSSKGNLNFNYKLLFLPPCLRDYIVVHELCHLRVLNHSQAFWDEVVAIMPDALERAQVLRDLERRYGTSLQAIKNYPKVHLSHEVQAGELKQDRAAVFVPPQCQSSERAVR